ncbi:MAG TPA: hypothetical protein VLT87_11240 [Thermoanaerobaculia bacterium]|nr:hypothetical protein [Thermoanaerobaculia bacterium]
MGEWSAYEAGRRLADMHCQICAVDIVLLHSPGRFAKGYRDRRRELRETASRLEVSHG